jgi:electron transfer flavoprotein-quinone oxidoreductase
VSDFDVIVVGAGPAGSAAAYTAAKGGAKVLLIERGPEPGSKNVSGAMVRLSEISRVFDIKSLPIERKVTNVRITISSVNGKLKLETEAKENLANVSRLKLDKWLAQNAESAGAILVTKTTVLGIEGKKVITDRGSVTGERIVLAEGANPIISIKLGIRRDLEPNEAIQTVKEVYNLSIEEVNKRFGLKDDSQGLAWRILFDSPLPGAGFVYTYRDSVAIGIGVPMQLLIKQKMKPYTVLEKLKEELGLNELIKGMSLREYSAKIIPENGFPEMRGCRGNIYLAGDALGFIDSLNFNGIGPAIVSGSLAGKAALEGIECSKFEYLLMQEKEISRIVKIRPLVRELLQEENFRFYLRLLNDIMNSWVSGDYGRVTEYKGEITKLIKHGLMLIGGVL